MVSIPSRNVVLPVQQVLHLVKEKFHIVKVHYFYIVKKLGELLINLITSIMGSIYVLEFAEFIVVSILDLDLGVICDFTYWT